MRITVLFTTVGIALFVAASITKGIDWSYEAEWRMIMPLLAACHVIGDGPTSRWLPGPEYKDAPVLSDNARGQTHIPNFFQSNASRTIQSRDDVDPHAKLLRS